MHWPVVHLPQRISIPWISAISTLVLYILTILYASQSTLLSQAHFVGSSPSYTILVLRVLSEIAGVLLGTTISTVFELLQCMLVSRNSGRNMRLIDYLGLEAGTGVLGLFGIVLSTGLSKITRVWGTVRLVSIVMVPLLNILIMACTILGQRWQRTQCPCAPIKKCVVTKLTAPANVDTRSNFRAMKNIKPSYIFGIGEFNSSLVNFWAPMTDMLFSNRFDEFLKDTNRVVDLTDPGNRDACDRGYSCNQTYFVSGGIENLSPQLINDTISARADAFIVEGQQGYLFSFESTTQGLKFNGVRHCRTYPVKINAWALCLDNEADDVLASKLVFCPNEIASRSECLNNTSWMTLPGWTTRLKTAYQRADIVYSRLNGTILAYDSAKYPRKTAGISGQDVLAAFDVAFSGKSNNTTIDRALQLVGKAPNPPVIPLYLWWFFDRLSETHSGNQATYTRAIAGFQSLLVTPIYYCQSKGWAELRRVGYGNQSSIGAVLLSQFPPAEPDVPVYPAQLRYALVVGRGTLIAYSILGGLSLVLCFLALVLDSTQSGTESLGEKSSFPTLDFRTMWELLDEGGGRISDGVLRSLRNMPMQKLIRTVSKMKVVPRGRSTQNEAVLPAQEIEMGQQNALLSDPQALHTPGRTRTL